MDCSMLGSSIPHYLLEFTQIHVHWASDAIYPILCCPLLLLPSIFPSIRGFSNETVLCIRWPKYGSFRISPSNEYSGLISFKIHWIDLAVQETLKSLFQHHNSKELILWHPDFFMVQLSHLYMTTGKNHSFDYKNLCCKVMSLLLNMLSRLLITFLPRSMCLLISWLQSPSAVILEPKKIKSIAVSIVCPSIFHEVMGPDAMIFECWVLSHVFHFPLSSSSRGSCILQGNKYWNKVFSL